MSLSQNFDHRQNAKLKYANKKSKIKSELGESRHWNTPTTGSFKLAWAALATGLAKVKWATSIESSIKNDDVQLRCTRALDAMGPLPILEAETGPLSLGHWPRPG